MLSWAAPWWLCGLALLPLIRWLHRGGRQRRALRVSRLDLWKGSSAAPSAAGERLPPDPAWRRRALLAALLCIALAGPGLPQRNPAITLWVDDSLSMLARDAGSGTEVRLVAGLAQARAQLDRVAHGEVAVRALSDPWRDRGAPDASVVAALAAGAGRSEPSAPPAALLGPDRLHWLVTDGAHPALLAWPGDARPDHLVQVAGGTRNVGLERLSARRHGQDPQKIDLLVKLRNGGMTVESRELVLASEAGELARSAQRLEPGAAAFVSASVPSSAKLRAMLQPGDALAEDDVLELDLAALRRRRIAIDPRCPQALAAAVRAHPALQAAPGDAADVDAVLDCSGRRPDAREPTLSVLADRMPQPPGAALSWPAGMAQSRRVDLDEARLRMAAQLQPRPADAVLLASGDEALIVARSGPSKRLETSLDFAAMASTAGPETPLLVNLLFEQLFDTPLLDAIALAERGPAASHVAAAVDPGVGETAPRAGAAHVPHDASRALLLAALLVLLWEIAALALQVRRLRMDPE